VELEANKGANGLAGKWQEGHAAATSLGLQHGQQQQQQQQQQNQQQDQQQKKAQQQKQPLLLVPPPISSTAVLGGPPGGVGNARGRVCDIDTPQCSPRTSRDGVTVNEEMKEEGQAEDGSGMQTAEDWLSGVLLGPIEGHEAGVLSLQQQQQQHQHRVESQQVVPSVHGVGGGGHQEGGGTSRGTGMDPERGEGGT